MKHSFVVKPNSKADHFQFKEERFWVKLKARPVDGAANEYLIKLLSEKLGIKRNEILIQSGYFSSLKILELPVSREMLI